jgi:hypothetical protein
MSKKPLRPELVADSVRIVDAVNVALNEVDRAVGPLRSDAVLMAFSHLVARMLARGIDSGQCSVDDAMAELDVWTNLVRDFIEAERGRRALNG